MPPGSIPELTVYVLVVQPFNFVDESLPVKAHVLGASDVFQPFEYGDIDSSQPVLLVESFHAITTVIASPAEFEVSETNLQVAEHVSFGFAVYRQSARLTALYW